MNKNITLLCLLTVAVLLSIGVKNCAKGKNDTNNGNSLNTYIIFAPSNLNAITASPYRINLSWVDISDDEDGFEVERKTDSTEYILLTTVISNTAYYSDNRLSPTTRYYYRVRAYNSRGYSAYTNEANATTFPSPSWDVISVGSGHTIVHDMTNNLWGWGNNYSFQLGIGDTDTRLFPIPLGNDSSWEAVAAGRIHTIGIKTNNTIWGWGDDASGQLGWDPELGNAAIPFQIVTESDWSTVAAGGDTTFAIKTNQTLWAWGDNWYGQLGLGDALWTNRFSPTRVGTDSDWSSIRIFWMNTYALKTNGTMWSWGTASREGALGLGDTMTRTTPSLIGSQTDWAEVSSGQYHAIARKIAGTIWTWGNNDYGQLGLGFNGYWDYSNPDEFGYPTYADGRNTPTQVGTDSDWIMTQSGAFHNITLKTNGTMWSWGNNNNGQLGLGDNGLNTNRNTPTQIGTQTDWSAIAAGSSQSFAFKTNRTLWAWGRNLSSQLGLSDTIDRNTPTLVGE